MAIDKKEADEVIKWAIKQQKDKDSDSAKHVKQTTEGMSQEDKEAAEKRAKAIISGKA